MDFTRPYLRKPAGFPDGVQSLDDGILDHLWIGIVVMISNEDGEVGAEFFLPGDVDEVLKETSNDLRVDGISSGRVRENERSGRRR